MHMNPEFFGDNVDKFDPERFLDGAGKDVIDNHLFHAFGGGPRICIGMRFAMEEIKIIIAKLLSNFKIIQEPNVTKLDFNRGDLFLMTYPEMKARIQKRN